MSIIKKESAPRYIRPEGIISYLLVSSRTCNAKHLTTTLVKINPGGKQHIHSHDPEQIYFIIDGSGLMTVGEKTFRVQPDDCVFIPSGVLHGLKNDGSSRLKYFSAAAEMFPVKQLEEWWPLPAENES